MNQIANAVENPKGFSGSVNAELLPAQKKRNEIFRVGLARGSVNFQELEELYHQSVSEFAEEKKKVAVETDRHSAALSADFQRDLQALRDRLTHVLLVPPLASSAQLYLVDTATNISASRLTLSATNVARLNNSAQFDYSTRDTSIAIVDFTYQWTNPTDRYAIINVTGFISFNGSLVASTDGSMWPIDHQHAYTSIDAYVKVATFGAIYTGTFVNVSTFNADSGGGWLGNPGVYKTTTLFRGVPATEELLTVRPQDTITIDVVGQLSSDMDSGYGDYNFKDQGRQVTSAGVIVNVIS